jgi:transcriptional regulator with XRE-family HTH domain
MDVQALRSPAAIASTLRAIREAQHLTQREMAATLGLVLRQYERWEAGIGTPRVILVCYPDDVEIDREEDIAEMAVR